LWTGAPNKDFLREFTAAWSKFLDALKDDLKPLFKKEFIEQSYRTKKINPHR